MAKEIDEKIKAFEVTVKSSFKKCNFNLQKTAQAVNITFEILDKKDEGYNQSLSERFLVSRALKAMGLPNPEVQYSNEEDSWEDTCYIQIANEDFIKLNPDEFVDAYIDARDELKKQNIGKLLHGKGKTVRFSEKNQVQEFEDQSDTESDTEKDTLDKSTIKRTGPGSSG